MANKLTAENIEAAAQHLQNIQGWYNTYSWQDTRRNEKNIDLVIK